MSNSVNIGLNMTGNIVDRFSQLSDKVQEVEKSVKKLGPEFKNLAGTGIGSNPKLHSIISGTDFKGGFDGILKSIKKNKIKAYDGGILGQKELAGILDTRNALKSAQLGAKASGYKDIEKMLKAPVERYEALLKAMDVSLTRVKAMDLKDGDLKSTEKAIKKFVDDANKLILTTENSFNGMGKTAAGAFKKAKPKKTQDEWKNDVRTKDFSYSSKRYKNDQEYRRHVDNALNYYQMKAGNYGTIGESALTNASLKAGKMFGNTNTQYNGFFQELGQGLTNGINEGFKNFDLGELIGGTIKKGGTFRRQNKVLEKLGYESDFLGMTDAFQNTKSFKEFADKKRAEMGEFGKNWDNKSIFSAFKGTDEFKELTKKVKENKEIDFSQLSSQDRSKVLAGLTNNKQAASMMGGLKMGGVFLTAAAGVKKLLDVTAKLGTEAIKAYEGVQQLQTQLGVVFGTKVQSASMFNQIEDYAKKSPFGVEGMVQNAVLLKQSGVYGSELMDTLKRLGDISSGNNAKMKSVSEVYARVMSSQSVTARDMRQLANAGVPSYSALADATGIDRGQIRQKLQAGQIKATDFEKMLKALTDKGGMFYGATATGAQTLAAKKQNLADARQMMMASFGERIARAGGITTNDSFYGETLNWLQGIFNSIEEGNAIANRKKDAEAPEQIAAEIERLEAKKSSAKNLMIAEKYDEKIKELKGQLKTSEQQAVASGDQDYKQAVNKLRFYDDFFQNRSEYKIRPSAIKTDEEKVDTLRYLKYLNNEQVAVNGVVQTTAEVLELFEKWNEKHKKDIDSGYEKPIGAQDALAQFNAIMEMGTGERSKAVSFGEDVDKKLAKGLSKSKLDFDAYSLDTLSRQISYDVKHFYSEVAKATDEGSTWLNKAIENTTETFDKFENVNIGPGAKNNYGAQHLMNSADEYYRENSSVYKMSWKDRKAMYDEMAKQEILSFDKRAKTGKKDENGEDIYSFAKMTAEEMKRAQELLTVNAEKIMTQGTKYDFVDTDDNMTDEGLEKLQKLKENFSELLDVAKNTDDGKVFGEDFMASLKALTDLLSKDFGNGADALLNLGKMMEFITKTGGDLERRRLELEGKLAEYAVGTQEWSDIKAQIAKVEAMQANRSGATQDKTFSAKKAEKINERLAPNLKSQIISQITGVSADRVANTWNKRTGQNASMNAYIDNFSQRQTFAQLGKALMQNGTELKDVAKALQSGKNGQKYGMYDWDKSTSSIEGMAAQKNVATQEALIAAYQQQIDALHELTVGSIATRDQWDNLNSLSAQLGVGFELAAKELADGTVQFTDVTIQSAHKMLEELNIKKFNQQMDTILNRVVEDLKDKQKEASLETSVLTGGMGHYVTNENAGSYVQVAKGQAAEIAKTEIPVLVDKVWKKGPKGGLVFDSKEGAENQAREFQKLFKDRTIKVQAVEVKEGKEGNFAKLSAIANTRLSDQWKASGTKLSFKDWAYEKVPWKLAGGKEKTRWEIGYSDVLNENGYGRPIFSGGDRGGKANDTNRFYLTSIAGKEESDYKASTGEPKIAYKIEGVSEKEVEDSIRSLVAALNDGTLPKSLASLFLALTGLDQTENELTKKIEDNTAAQSTNDAIKEVHQLSDQFKAYFGSIGILGNTPEEREAAKLKEESKPFKDMERHSPMMNHANTPDREAMMALLGIDRHTDYEAYRLRRMGEALNFDSIDKNENKLLDKDDIKGAEREEKGPRKGQIKGLKLSGDEVTQANVKNFLINGEGRGYTRKLFNNKETGYKDKHKTLDSFKDTIENMDSSAIDTLIGKLQDMGVPLEDFVRKMQESSEFTMVANDKIKDMTDTLKDSSFSTAVNLVNSGLKQAGDNAYKLDNNLIKGKDAAKATKQALAGVQAALLESIGAAMTQTGLSIAAGAAKDGLWGMVAMGLALAAAGGVASFGSGMMSAYANDKSKDKSSEEEDRLKRLEDLKNNLADLLKQAKDD
ncbi:MAG: tape measure protein, partial [Treponema sp.]|nr:tape measure protein [Treponema sp.]